MTLAVLMMRPAGDLMRCGMASRLSLNTARRSKPPGCGPRRLIGHLADEPGTEGADAGVVVQDVEAAECVKSSFDDARRRAVFDQIGLQRRNSLVIENQVCPGPVDRQHLGPLGGEQIGAGAADAGRTPP